MQKRTIFIVALLAVALFMPAVAPGQAKKIKNPKYVVSIAMYEDNQIAQGYIIAADKLVKNGEIAEAIETYQQALEDTLDNNPSALVEVEESAEDKLIYCRPCLDVIRDRMMCMGVEDIAVYRKKYEYATERMVNKAVANRDMAAVLDISRRRPYTVAGIRAARVSAAVAMENCDYALAADISNRALEIVGKYPDIFGGPDMATFCALAANACAAAGNKTGLDRVAGIVSANKALGEAKIRKEGKTVVLADYVKGVVGKFSVPETPTTAGYPMLGGDNERSKMMSGRGGIGAQKWHYELKYSDKDFYGRVQKIRSDILIAPVPVAGIDRIYLNTGYDMVAVSEYDGTEVFGEALTQPDKKRTREYVQENLDSCTIRGDIVYFVETVGSADLDITYHERIKLPNFRRLAAVNIKDGTRRWNTDDDTGLDREEFVCGSPAVYRDTILFQVMRHIEVADYYDLLCVDADTGVLRWRLPLVRKAAGEASYNYQRRSPNIVAVKDDIAIVTTAAGSVTAVDLITQTIKWGAKFHSDAAAHRGGERTGDYRLEAGADCTNPPMIVGDKVVLKPSESRRIYCLDLETGRLRWQVEHPTISYIAGVDYVEKEKKNGLFVVGPGVKIIDVENGDEIFSEDYPRGKVYNHNNFLLAGHVGNFKIKGRPALTKEGLYISTTDGLFRFDRKTRAVPEKLFDWADRGLLPGNLLMTANGFYVANCDGITAFYTPAAIDAITKRLADDPDNPALFYQRGMTRLGFGMSKEALADLEKAAAKVGQQELNGRPLTDLIREGRMDACVAQARRESTAGNHDAAVGFAEQSVGFAMKPAEKVRAFEALATVNAAAGAARIPAAIAAWQHIVEECPDELGEFGVNFSRVALLYAVEKIAADIRQHGRAAYAEVEKRAAAELTAAASDADVKRVFARYPNSLAAFAAVGRFAGDSDGLAFSLMMPMIERCDVSAATAQYFVKAYRLAWGCGETFRAEGILNKLAGLPADVKVSLDGKQVAVGEFVKTHRAELDAVRAAAPVNAHFPADAVLDEAVLNAFPAVTDERFSHVSFVAPTGPRPGIMKNRVLIRNSGYVYCTDTNTGRILWQNPGTVRLWLGMSISEIKSRGVLKIDKIFPKSEAEKVGLKPGDIIINLNSQRAKSFDVWRKVLDNAKSGDDIQVEYERNGKKATVVVKATPLPPDLAKQSRQPAISSVRYVGGNRIVVISSFPTTTARCIDLATGQTLWQSGGYAKWLNRVNGGLLVTGGLFVGLAEFKRGSSITESCVVAVDTQTGKAVARISVDGAVDEYGIVGDMLLVLRDNLCVAYGVLDGKKKCEFRLRKTTKNQRDYVDGFRVAASRVFIYADLNDRLRSIDMFNGNDICEPCEIPGSRIVFNNSERYVAVYSHRSTFGDIYENNTIHIFDGMAVTGSTNVEFAAPVDHLTISGSRIYSHALRGWRYYFASYDIEADKMYHSMTVAENNKKHYDFEYYVGEYVVMGDITTINPPAPTKPSAGAEKGAQPAKPGAQPAPRDELRIAVFDKNGKKYCEYEIPWSDIRGRIEGWVADGKLHVLAGKKLYVFKAPK